MGKKLGEAKAGEKIYKVSVGCSRVLGSPTGEIIKELTIEKTEELGDTFSIMFTLSDDSHIRGHRNNEIMSAERLTDEKLAHPMAMFEDFYCQDRKKLLNELTYKLNQDIERFTSLRTEALMLMNDSLVSRGVIESIKGTIPEESEMTEEEFAEMALA